MSDGRSGDRAERWNERYRDRERAEPAATTEAVPGPSGAMVRLSSTLPTAGVAIDLAGGDGGDAIALADWGLDAVLVDWSRAALDRATTFAARLDRPLTTVRLDLAGRRLADVLAAIGEPRPAVVTCVNYLDRDLLASVAADLPPGGRFLASIATTTNLERNQRPPAPFLLGRGELFDLVTASRPDRLRVLHRRQGWCDDRHHAEVAVEAR
ncbi:MAG: class I SAM-dependent methyltransferase [Actinomycetota bacterium]